MSTKQLRWGISTGACAAALAVAAWRTHHGETCGEVSVLFPDGKMRVLPLLPPEGPVVSIRKDGGDDPDCTHGARLFGCLRSCTEAEGREEDYSLAVGDGTVIVRGAGGVGLCTRTGLDCERGKWAINIGPRRMIADNLHTAGLDAGCWLFELGVEDGEALARRTLNPRLGIVGGISILGTTGLVRPYSHEAYIETVRICVRSHALSGGREMVFCTGGRTQNGARVRLPERPETGFACIGDFIAESLAAACEYGMREISVACMAGKLCKYAAGFENTHAHKVSQDMALLRAEVRRVLPGETALHEALEHSVSVREALLALPETARPALLHRLARTALEQFARRCTGNPALRLMVFDFEGQFLFEETRAGGVGSLDVVSCGIGFPEGTILNTIADADIVYGSRLLLELCPVPLREARPIGGNAREDALTALAECRSGRRVVALASGDALYHGFGGTLAALATGEALTFHPGITAFQALFHRLGLAWHKARLFSVHSGEDVPGGAIAASPLSVTYGGSRFPASAVARAVLGVHPASASRAAVLAERLGTADERLLSGTVAELAATDCGPTSMLVILPGESAPILPLGLPEEDYDRENNLITASDVRAVILSRLRLPAWGVLWDIGAGSGSVGLEAAALRPDLRVEAVERSASRGERIARNRERLGVTNYRLHIGEALSFVREAETPDRVFVGGGGRDLPEILERCMERLRPGGLLVASAVTLESVHTLLGWRPDLRTALCRLDVAHEQPLAGAYHHLKAQNTIHICTFAR